LSILLVIVVLLGFLPLGAGAAPDLGLPGLAGIYRDYFMIGGCFGADKIAGERGQLFFHHYNAMTAENAMKPASLYNAGRELDFSAIDGLLAGVAGYGNTLHGHTLVWHEQTPAWMTQNKDGSPLAREEAQRNMAAHIGAVAGHFAGQVYSWDVLNEAMEDLIVDRSDWRVALRKTAWYNAFANGGPGEGGDGHIDFAFRQARAADPGAILYYNDYGLDKPRKARAVATMAAELNGAWLAEGNARPLIEGIGMQGHYSLSTSAADVEKSIQLFAELGVRVSISELDINAKPGGPDEMLKQAVKYAELFVVFMRHSDVVERVSFWGLDDGTSWLNLPQFGGPGAEPLLFDAGLNAKQAYYAAADPEGFLQAHGAAPPRQTWLGCLLRPFRFLYENDDLYGGDIFKYSRAAAVWLAKGLASSNKYARCGYSLLYYLLWPGARAVHWARGILGK